MSLFQKDSSHSSIKVIKFIILSGSCSNQREIFNFTNHLNCNKTHTRAHMQYEITWKKTVCGTFSYEEFEFSLYFKKNPSPYIMFIFISLKYDKS